LKYLFYQVKKAPQRKWYAPMINNDDEDDYLLNIYYVPSPVNAKSFICTLSVGPHNNLG
jgi:hypothetical protein